MKIKIDEYPLPMNMIRAGRGGGGINCTYEEVSEEVLVL
jgi:hypothetical protein